MPLDLAIIAAREMLNRAGCECEVAKSGKEAITKFDQSFDLILLDIGLPDTHGLDLARLIRSQSGAISQIPIVVVTAREKDSGCDQRASIIGLNGYFAKPLTQELCQKLIAGISRGETDFWEE